MNPFLLLAICVVMVSADSPYSDSIVSMRDMSFFIDESFISPKNAYANVDFQIEYGYPYGAKTKRSTAFIEMYGDGAQRYRIEDIQIIVENPLTYIRASAVLNVKWFYDPNNTLVLSQQMFTMEENTWRNENTSFNITFNRPRWFLAGSYSKICANPDQFGFQCNVLCPKPSTAIECYRCDPTTGNKTCCAEPDYDPYTCYRRGTNGTIPGESCESKLVRVNEDYRYQKKWRTIFFWMMIGFAVIALIFLAIIFCCLFSMLHCRRRAEEEKRVYPADEDWPQSGQKVYSIDEQLSQPRNEELPYTEIYRHKRVRPSNPVSPEFHRRRAASVTTIESEVRSSAIIYPTYAESPKPRRRIEQLV